MANAITDGEFENWTSATNLTSWTEVAAGSSTLNRDGADFHGGLYSVRCDIDASSNHAGPYQTITLVAGAPYELSVWYKVSAAGKTCAWLLLNSDYNVHLGSDGTWIAGASSAEIVLPSATTWTCYNLRFKAHASYTSYLIQFLDYTDSSYSFWFDDAILAPVPRAQVVNIL